MAAPPVSLASVGAFPYGAPAEASARFCPWCYRDGDATCSVQAHWPEVRAHDPLLLSGVDCAATRAMEAAGLGAGLMLQLGSGLAARAGQQPGRWLTDALDEVGALTLRHGGNYRYAWAVGDRRQRRRTRIALGAQPYPKHRDD